MSAAAGLPARPTSRRPDAKRDLNAKRENLPPSAPTANPAPDSDARSATSNKPPRDLLNFVRVHLLYFLPFARSELSCTFFPYPRPLFSIVCGLFFENTGGGIPLLDLQESRVTNHKSHFSPDFHESQVTSRQLRRLNSFRFRSYADRPILHYFGANKSFRMRSYRHPARNSFRIRSYKNPGGWGPLPLPDLHESPVTNHKSHCSVTTFRINTCISVASKRLYLSLESTLMKKGGRGDPCRPLHSQCPSLHQPGRDGHSIWKDRVRWHRVGTA
jgi:hypothetical protein